MAGEMEVEHVIPLTYCDRYVFETGVKYTASSWSNELEKEEFATSASEKTRRSRPALSLHHRRIQEADVPRAPRSRSSPDRRTDTSSPRRTSSPSATVLRNTPLPTPPAFPLPLLCNNNNAFGVVAFYSPRPPATPLFLVHLPPNPATPSGQRTKTAQPAELQTKVKCPDKKENKSKKFKSKESKKVVRYVMQTVLRGVYAGTASRVHRPEEASGDSSRVHVEDISPAKDVPASPLFHSVASQTKPKTSFIRPNAIADADMDDLSISSEERCTELDESCEWAGDVRALRDSHVRLVLRQLQQLREIERLNRTLQRARAASQSPVQTPPTASAAHSAC